MPGELVLTADLRRILHSSLTRDTACIFIIMFPHNYCKWTNLVNNVYFVKNSIHNWAIDTYGWHVLVCGRVQ